MPRWDVRSVLALEGPPPCGPGKVLKGSERMKIDKGLANRSRPAHNPVFRRDNLSVIVFVTVCTEGRRPVLQNADVHRLLCATWSRFDAWMVGRYVLMPDHLHLFCAPGRAADPPVLARWVAAWKSASAASWASVGLGKIWQRDFWDTQLRRGDSYTDKWEYVRMNPVRKGLVTECEMWPYQGELNELLWHDAR